MSHLLPSHGGAPAPSPSKRIWPWVVTLVATIVAILALTVFGLSKIRPLTSLEVGFASVAFAAMATILIVSILNLPVGEEFILQLEGLIRVAFPKLHTDSLSRYKVTITAGVTVFFVVLLVMYFVAQQEAPGVALKKGPLLGKKKPAALISFFQVVAHGLSAR